jgi:hypothetical protein
VHGAGLVGGVLAGLIVALVVLVAAGEDENVLGSDVKVAREGAPRRAVADEQEAAGGGIAGERSEAGAADEAPVPLELVDLRQLGERRRGEGEPGESRRGGVSLERGLGDPLPQASPEPGGERRARQAAEEGAAGRGTSLLRVMV